MGDLSARNFGLVIAYLVPGFVALWGLGCISEQVELWLTGAGGSGPGVGSFLCLLLASVAAGMTASAVRWALLDTIHQHTGLRRPLLNESGLPERLEAFDYLVENHYRYYQFYGNTLVAAIFAYGVWRGSSSSTGVAFGWPEAVVFGLVSVFAAGSRDALRKYYLRAAMLLGVSEREVNDDERQPPQTVSGAEHAEGRHPEGE